MKETTVERLKWRVQNYRKKQTCIGRQYERFQNGIYEQNCRGTEALRQRFLGAKGRKSSKKIVDKKQEYMNMQLSKTAFEEPEPSMNGMYPNSFLESECSLSKSRKTSSANPSSSSSTNPTGVTAKLSVAIYQQLNGPQQIQTNVTVKAMSSSLKSDVESNKKQEDALIDFKQEADSNNSNFPDNGVLTSEEVDAVNPYALNAIMSNIELPANIDFDVETACGNFFLSSSLKQDPVHKPNTFPTHQNNPNMLMCQSQTTEVQISSATVPLITSFSSSSSYKSSQPTYLPCDANRFFGQSCDVGLLPNLNVSGESQNIAQNHRSYSGVSTDLESGPAAQTLKHMAQQHQQQRQMGVPPNLECADVSSPAYAPNCNFAPIGEGFEGSQQHPNMYTNYCSAQLGVPDNNEQIRLPHPDITKNMKSSHIGSSMQNRYLDNNFRNKVVHNQSIMQMMDSNQRSAPSGNDMRMQSPRNMSVQSCQSTAFYKASPLEMQMSQNISLQASRQNCASISEVISHSVPSSDYKQVQLSVQQQQRLQQQVIRYRNPDYTNMTNVNARLLQQNQMIQQAVTLQPPSFPVSRNTMPVKSMPQENGVCHLQQPQQTSWQQTFTCGQEPCFRGSYSAAQPFDYQQTTVHVTQQQSLQMRFRQPYPVMSSNKTVIPYEQMTRAPW